MIYLFLSIPARYGAKPRVLLQVFVPEGSGGNPFSPWLIFPTPGLTKYYVYTTAPCTVLEWRFWIYGVSLGESFFSMYYSKRIILQAYIIYP